MTFFCNICLAFSYLRFSRISQLNAFITKLLKTNDKIVILLDGQLDLKIKKLEKKYQKHRDIGFVQRIKKIYGRIYYNSNKCKLVNVSSLSEELDTFFEENPTFAKDKFLFETAMQTNERFIVTTDERLISTMNGKEQCSLILLDKFLGRFGRTVNS